MLATAKNVVKFNNIINNGAKLAPAGCRSMYKYPIKVPESLDQVTAHTDLRFAKDYDTIRTTETLDPHAKTNNDGRKAFNYAVIGSTFAGTAVIMKSAVRGMAEFFMPNKTIMEASNLEVDLSEIPEGKNVIVMWRGKPVFIRHRSDAEIQEQMNIDVSGFRDPVPDEDRFHDMKWMVVIGICTHLGCIPIDGKGEFGGYYCPCHGSHYDVAGRIRKGPAPRNLEVPPYTVNGTTLVVG